MLHDLITQRMRANSWSLNDVVQRAEAAGEKLGRSNLARIKSGEPVLAVSKATIFALAHALRVTPLTVGNAALESMGVQVDQPQTTDTVETIGIDPTLTDENRRLLTTIIDQMRTENAARAGDDTR